MLKITDLRTTFKTPNGQAQGVKGISMSLADGEFYTLLGPSGCGKTTTLRSVAGFETPDEGEITIDGDVVYSAALRRVTPTSKRGLGMVFQSYAIWPHMSVFENVAYPLRYGYAQNHTEKEVRGKVNDVLDLVRLNGFEDKLASRLSGGQQQRVALARAIVQRPRIILMDEPLSNLDAALREKLRGEIKTILGERKITTLYVTHDRLEALAMSDRVAIMQDGLIAQEGTPWDLYTAPANAFVAGFLGTVNLFTGKLAERMGHGMGRYETPFGVVLAALPEGLDDSVEVNLIVRPERIDVSSKKTGDPGTFPAVIESVMFLGEAFDCQLRIGEHTLRATLPWVERFQAGDNVEVRIEPKSWIVTSR